MPNPVMMRRLMGAVNPYPITLLLKDLFTTNEAAPIASPRTCEPGPGSWNVLDTGNKFSIAGGIITPASRTVDGSDPRLSSVGTFARVAGLAAWFKFFCDDKNDRQRYGWVLDVTLTSLNNCVVPLSGNLTENRGRQLLTSSDLTEYKFHIILRSSGAFYIFDNKLLFASIASNSANLRLIYSIDNAGVQPLDDVKCAQLGAPWNTAYGPGELLVSGAIPAGQTVSHEPNFGVYFTLTSNGTAGATDIRFRIQDATNYWQLLISNDGSSILNEVVAGVPTSRGSSAAGTFADGERCAIVCFGTNIYIHDGTSRLIAYTSAVNFQTATSGKVEALATGAQLNNLELYPYDLTGDALAWVQALEAA